MKVPGVKWGQIFIIDSYSLGKIMVLNLHEDTVNGSLYNATIINKIIKKMENKKETKNSRPLFPILVVPYFLLSLAVIKARILLQGQNKERALRGAKGLVKVRKEQIIFLSLYRCSVNIISILWFYVYLYGIFLI